MTAFKDAMHKAGVDTAAAELYATTTDYLRKPESANRRLDALIVERPDLRAVVLAEYIARVRADMKGQTYQPPRAPTPSLEIIPPTRPKAKHAADAEPKTGKIKVKKHERRRAAEMATERQAKMRQATVNAWKSGADAIYAVEIGGRPIGEITIAEIGRLREDRALNGRDHIRFGMCEIARSVLFEKIANYAVVTDQTMAVHQVVPAKALEQMALESAIETLPLAEEHARKYARHVNITEGEPNHAV